MAILVGLVLGLVALVLGAVRGRPMSGLAAAVVLVVLGVSVDVGLYVVIAEIDAELAPEQTDVFVHEPRNPLWLAVATGAQFCGGPLLVAFVGALLCAQLARRESPPLPRRRRRAPGRRT